MSNHHHLTNVVCSVQEYQSSNLREYFDEEALLIPVETIIGNI